MIVFRSKFEEVNMWHIGCQLQSYLQEMANLHVNQEEFVLLRALVLVNSGRFFWYTIHTKFEITKFTTGLTQLVYFELWHVLSKLLVFSDLSNSVAGFSESGCMLLVEWPPKSILHS